MVGSAAFVMSLSDQGWIFLTGGVSGLLRGSPSVMDDEQEGNRHLPDEGWEPASSSLFGGLVTDSPNFGSADTESPQATSPSRFPVETKMGEIFSWGVNVDDYGLIKKASLHGFISEEPDIDENELVSFKMKIQLDNSWQELKILLGHLNWYVSSYKIPSKGISGERIWRFVSVEKLASQLGKKEPVLVWIPMEFKNELSVSSNFLKDDCVWCKEKFELDKEKVSKNKKIIEMLVESKNFKYVPELGSVDSLAY